MNPDSGQRAIDARNLFLTVSGLVAVLFFLAVLMERTAEKGRLPAGSPHPQPVIVKTPAVPRTTVKIQPLITKFPPLPDFNADMSVEERKAAFIDYMAPIIEYQNSKILRERDRLEKISKKILNGEHLPLVDKTWLVQLAGKYDVEWHEENPAPVVIRLAKRVDIIPLSLALVQAAKESSWGRSRYAVEINNLFGQWCFDEGCGSIPGAREEGAVHEVKRFKSVYDATRSYIHNLNTHPRYAVLREIRQQLRIHNRPLTGSALADGLLYYSERRQAYVDEVKSMIRQFRTFQERRSG